MADVARTEADGSHDVSLRIELRNDRLRASAIEGAGAYELKSRRPKLDEPGWGTYLARELGQRWGSSHDAEHGSIWVEMALSIAAVSGRLPRPPRPASGRACEPSPG
jgi:hypothetical protein